jgi:bacteriocin biosynthesis cyclodehydratase domain-containing protein
MKSLPYFDDPDLRFPRHPAFLPDLRVYEMPDGLGLQIQGAEKPVMLRGKYAAQIVRYLRESTTELKTLKQLVILCPKDIPRDALFKALRLLHGKGVIGEADPKPTNISSVPVSALDRTLQRQILFFGRYIDVTRNAQTGAELQNRLRHSRVLLIGTGLVGTATFDLLHRSGCRNIELTDWDDDGSMIGALKATYPLCRYQHNHTRSIDAISQILNRWGDAPDLVAAAVRNAPDDLFSLINEYCVRNCIPWTRVSVSGTELVLGPSYVGPGSACFGCFKTRLLSSEHYPIEYTLNQRDLSQEKLRGTTEPIGEAIYLATLAASLVTGEVVRILTEFAPASYANAFVRLSAISSDLEKSAILPMPRCSECYRGWSTVRM